MLSVGVFVDLWWRPEAGGHVKCWEWYAKAAVALGDRLDLTLHFLGKRQQVVELSEQVRYVLHPPLFSTDCLPFLRGIADVTDLAPLNPQLFPYLRRYDVLHATHPLFVFGRTALYFARRTGTPLVASIHTDVPKYTEIYTPQIIRRLLGQRGLSQLLLDRWQIHRRQRQAMERQLERYWPFCDRVIVSQPEDYEKVARVIPSERVSYLKRGIDSEQFHPRRRDRKKLQQTYNIPPDKPLLLFVGRLDPCKRVSILAQAARLLLDRGLPIHTCFVGKGNSATEIQALLGKDATLTGIIPHADLGWIYASADLFVFPSDTETYGNVVVEAKACGLPVIVSARGGTAQQIRDSGRDGLLIAENDPQAWAAAIAELLQNPTALTTMGQAARHQIESDWPSWQDVLEQDLLSVWQSVNKP